ncbi:MAG: LytTR family transcriptional regulator DNA-binding domain-containing protein [Clostridium sp.]|nr:LytTR family transcriptional regulator DNA-binding domain-containing protein [Clostridium sp.]
MNIIIQDCPEDAEDEIIIRCKQVDEELLTMIYALKAGRDKMTVSKGEKIFQITPAEIYYFESVDNRVFAYTQKEVYEVKGRLYDLEERFRHTDFFRASKSTIINLSKVKNFSPGFNGRFEACLDNGEKLIVSRQYAAGLKEKLGL